jgi:hypothetical protein
MILRSSMVCQVKVEVEVEIKIEIETEIETEIEEKRADYQLSIFTSP